MRCSFATRAGRTQWLIFATLVLAQARCVVKIEGLVQVRDSSGPDSSDASDASDASVASDEQQVTDAMVRDALADVSPNVAIPPPPAHNTPTLQPRRCTFSQEITDIFPDRLTLGTTPGQGAHLLTPTFRGMTAGREWLAAWAGADGILHELRVGTRGSANFSIAQRLGVPNVEQLWLDSRNTGVVSTDRYFLRSESGPTLTAITTSWFIGASQTGYVRLTEGRLFGASAFLGDMAWIPTVQVEDVLGGTRTSKVRIERLIPRSPDTVSDTLNTVGQTLAPQVAHGDSSAWLGFIEDSASTPHLAVSALDRSTAAPIGRLSLAEDNGQCTTTAFHLISASNLFGPTNVPVSVESCDANGLLLTVFAEFIRPMTSLRTLVREKEPGVNRSLRARVASNGAELAVAWVEPSDQNLSVRIYSGPAGMTASARLRIRSPEPVIENTIDIQGLPGDNGSWAVLWSTQRATYISRFGRCGTNPPGEN